MKQRPCRLLSLVLIVLLVLSGCSAGNRQKQTAGKDWHSFVDREEQTQEEDSSTTQESTPTQTPQQSTDSTNAQTPATTPSTTQKPATTPPQNDTVENGIFCLWVAPAGAKSRPSHAVKWQYVSHQGGHFLFCPTEGDVRHMQVWFQGAASFSLKGKTYRNGDAIDLSTLAGKGENTLTVGQDTYSLTVLKSANIGSLYIATASGNMDYIHETKGNEEDGTLRMADAAGKVLYEGNIKEFKGRGNSTWKREKKGYQFKLETKAELIANAGQARTWVLLANYGEKTLIRNTVGLNLIYDAGMKDTPRSTHVDLYCNGEYMGNYLLAEKVQVAEGRLDYNNLGKTTQEVNAADLKTYPTFGDQKDTSPGAKKGYAIRNNPADITGTYLLEIDMPERYAEEKSGFVTNRGKCIVIKEPEYASKEQVYYISNYFQEFEDAVFAEDGINPTTGKRFDQYFDLTSLARKYILEELVKNFDADKTSQYYYKPSNAESKVGYCGPAWDYDNAFDNFKPAAKNNGLYAAKNQKYLYYNMLKKDFFKQEVEKQWTKTYLPLIKMTAGAGGSPKGSLNTLNSYYKQLSPSAAMNFTLWDILDTPIFESTYVDTGSTYREHYDYLQDYLLNRANELTVAWGFS